MELNEDWPEGEAVDQIRQRLEIIQQRLFEIGSELASPPDGKIKYELLPEDAEKVLEESIDWLNGIVPPLKHFILPGGCRASCALHSARTVVRRAERSLLALDENCEVRPNLKRYVNRLSDWLFMAARFMNTLAGASETVWKGGE